MTRTSWLLSSLAAVLIAGCGGGARDTNETGAAGGAETGSMQGGTGTDTAAARTGDTVSEAGRSDSARGNQAESGVTNTETGEATTGEGVTKTRPDQGAPVQSKGDTLGQSGGDTVGGQLH